MKILQERSNEVLIQTVIGFLKVYFYHHEASFTADLFHGMNHLSSNDNVIMYSPSGSKIGLERRNALIKEWLDMITWGF